MGFRAAVSGFWAGLRAKSAPAAYGGGYAGGPLWRGAFRAQRQPMPFELVEAWKSIAWSLSTINANAVARVPLRLYAITKGGQAKPKCRTKAITRRYREHIQTKMAGAVIGAQDVSEVTDHPLLDAYHEVNQDFDENLLILYLSYCLDVVGHAYVWPEAKGSTFTLWPLQPQYVFLQRESGRAPVSGLTYFGETYEPTDVIRARFPSLRDPYGYGYGPTQALFDYLDLSDRYVSVSGELLGNAPRPSLMVSLSDDRSDLGPGERRALEADLNAGFAGARAGRVWVVPAQLKVDPLVSPPSDISGMTINHDALERAANGYGVPVSMLSSETNLANLQASRTQHTENAVEPRCLRIATALTKWTRAHGEGLGWDRLFWGFDPAVSEDIEQRAKVLTLEVQAGLRTLNEARGILSEEPYGEDGDVPLISGTLKPLDQVLNPPEPPPSPFGGGPGQPFGGKPSQSSGDKPEPPSEDKAEPLGEDKAEKALAEATATLKAIRRRLKVFDPKEVRDEAGRWAGGGDAHLAGLTPQRTDRDARRIAKDADRPGLDDDERAYRIAVTLLNAVESVTDHSYERAERSGADLGEGWEDRIAEHAYNHTLDTIGAALAKHAPELARSGRLGTLLREQLGGGQGDLSDEQIGRFLRAAGDPGHKTKAITGDAA